MLTIAGARAGAGAYISEHNCYGQPSAWMSCAVDLHVEAIECFKPRACGFMHASALKCGCGPLQGHGLEHMQTSLTQTLWAASAWMSCAVVRHVGTIE